MLVPTMHLVVVQEGVEHMLEAQEVEQLIKVLMEELLLIQEHLAMMQLEVEVLVKLEILMVIKQVEMVYLHQ